MRKFLGLAVIIALLSFVGTAHGSVGVWDEYAEQDRYVGEASNIKFEGQNVSSDGSQVTVLCNGHKNGVTTNTTDKVTNLTSKDLAYGVIALSDIGSLDSDDARYISLAAGTPGQMVTIILTGATGGTLYITDDKLSGTGQDAVVETGWDDIALGTALDTVTLLYVNDTYGWIITGQYGAAIT